MARYPDEWIVFEVVECDWDSVPTRGIILAHDPSDGRALEKAGKTLADACQPRARSLVLFGRPPVRTIDDLREALAEGIYQGATGDGR